MRNSAIRKGSRAGGRGLHGGSAFQLTMTAYQVQFLSGIADNFLRQVLIAKEHVQKVPQWYGETVGFWDGTTLVAWTANIQAWTQHTMFENSGRLEAVEIFKPAYDAQGKFVGLEEEAVFYDPEALLQPVRILDRFVRRATPDDPKVRYTFIECLSNIHNVDGGRGNSNRKTPSSWTTTGGRGRRSGKSTSRRGGTSRRLRACRKTCSSRWNER